MRQQSKALWWAKFLYHASWVVMFMYVTWPFPKLVFKWVMSWAFKVPWD